MSTREPWQSDQVERNRALPGGRLLWAALALLAPPGRRDEFLGDLMEELLTDVLPRRGRARATVWLWGQALASAPSLLSARLRRRPVRAPVTASGASAAAVGTVEAQRAFAAFLQHARHSPRRRRGALALAVAFHGALLGFGLVSSVWHVSELQPPAVVITWRPPVPPIASDRPLPGPGGGAGKQTTPRSERPKRTQTRRVQPVAQVNPQPAEEPADVTNPPGLRTEGGDERGGGDGRGPGPGGCQTPPCGNGSGGTSQIASVLADKQCQQCPLPSLPPAYKRAGLTQAAVLRICVDVRGRVASIQALRGISPEVDAGLAATIEAWQFIPYRIDGHPVPFCYVARFVFSSH